MDNNRISILPARFRDNATNTPVDGRGNAGIYPSSTTSSSQVSGSSLRLKELHEWLQLRSFESPARAELPPTWREQPVRNVVIASYKKNTRRYHGHNGMDWNAAQRARRDCFHDASWAEYYTQPRIPEGAVHLIVGDSLIRVLTRIQSHWQTGVLSFLEPQHRRCWHHSRW